jgi:hypothetical protein
MAALRAAVVVQAPQTCVRSSSDVGARAHAAATARAAWRRRVQHVRPDAQRARGARAACVRRSAPPQRRKRTHTGCMRPSIAAGALMFIGSTQRQRAV